MNVGAHLGDGSDIHHHDILDLQNEIEQIRRALEALFGYLPLDTFAYKIDK